MGQKNKELSDQLDRHDRLVVVWKLVVESHDNAVGHDGDDDDPLEGRPIYLEVHKYAQRYIKKYIVKDDIWLIDVGSPPAI